LKSRIEAECRYILEDGKEIYLTQIQNINEHFISLITPKNLDSQSHQNVIIQFKLNFDELCTALMANGIPAPDQMTVFRFYTALKYFETQAKNREKQKARQ